MLGCLESFSVAWVPKALARSPEDNVCAPDASVPFMECVLYLDKYTIYVYDHMNYMIIQYINMIYIYV